MDALKLAADLEKFASFVDENEGARQRAAKAQTSARAEKVASQYRDLLGDGFTPAMQQKLASLDEDALAVVEKLAAANAAPQSLGGPAKGAHPFSAPAKEDPLAEFTRTYSGQAR